MLPFLTDIVVLVMNDPPLPKEIIQSVLRFLYRLFKEEKIVVMASDKGCQIS
jgi:hypothetical protein